MPKALVRTCSPSIQPPGALSKTTGAVCLVAETSYVSVCVSVWCLHTYSEACGCVCMHVCGCREQLCECGGCLHMYAQACDVPVHAHVCASGPLAQPEARSSAPDAAPTAFIANSIQRRPPRPRQGRMLCYTEVLWFHSFIEKC